MAAIRLEAAAADNVENILATALLDSSSSSRKDKSVTAVDPLASSTWKEVVFFFFISVLSHESTKLCTHFCRQVI